MCNLQEKNMANLFDAISDNSHAIDQATLAGLHNQKMYGIILGLQNQILLPFHSLKKMPFYLNFISIM